MVGEKIHKAIKNRKKDLADLEADLTKLEKKIKKSEDKDEKLQEDIDELQPEVDALYRSEYNASLAYGTACEATRKAQTKVDNAEKAYEASYKTWNDHINSCYTCQSMRNCMTELSLSQLKQNDWEYLNMVKRHLSIAKTDEKKKRDAWIKVLKPYRKAEKKLNDLKEDKIAHVESHADLLEEEKALNVKIDAKEASIGEAESDLETNNDAQKKAPGYMERFNAAEAAGQDMDQWVEDNPPPDSVKNFTQMMQKYVQ